MKQILARAAFAAAALFFAAPAAAQETADDIPTLETLLTLAAQKPAEWKAKPYEAVDGKVGLAAYRGWRWFHGICHTCHGQDALGSTIAPDLIPAFSRKENPVTYESFIETVVNGRVVDGQLVMLAFKTNKDIVKNIDNLYAYLKARADGELGRGRPQRLKKK